MTRSFELIYETNKDVVACELGEGLAILDLGKDIYYSLDEVGAVAWTLLSNGPRSIEKVVDAVTADFAVDRQDCQDDVVALFGDLSRAGLIRPFHGQD